MAWVTKLRIPMDEKKRQGLNGHQWRTEEGGEESVYEEYFVHFIG